MEVENIYMSYNGICPYLPDRDWSTFCFRISEINSFEYADLMNMGFRRAGNIHYLPKCKNCEECVSLRVMLDDFDPTKGQRRTWRKNQDIQVQIHPPEYAREKLELYNVYVTTKHEGNQSFPINARDYQNTFITFPDFTYEMDYMLDGKLLGVGFVEVVENIISSSYFFYDTDYMERRLGIYSILCEIELGRQLGLDYLYLGYWVKDCIYMRYKEEFVSNQLLYDYSYWVDFRKNPKSKLDHDDMI
jgi:leucyl-tRNA---protein transferase